MNNDLIYIDQNIFKEAKTRHENVGMDWLQQGLYQN